VYTTKINELGKSKKTYWLSRGRKRGDTSENPWFVDELQIINLPIVRGDRVECAYYISELNPHRI